MKARSLFLCMDGEERKAGAAAGCKAVWRRLKSRNNLNHDIQHYPDQKIRDFYGKFRIV